MANLITCPHCSRPFELSDVLRHQIEEQILVETKSEHAKEVEQAKKAATQKLELELNALKASAAKNEDALRLAQEAELKLRQDKNLLEEQRRTWELEKTRQIDAERKAIRDQTSRELQESYHLKEKENQILIDSLKKSLEEAQRKASVGSQQLQGETLELELEQTLADAFRDDEIVPIAKGSLGADIRQIVKTPRGTVCGSILWESKRTKNWSEGWISKLKSDGLRDKADLLALISDVLPETVRYLGYYNGIHLCSQAFVLPLASLLRKILIEVTRQKINQENQTDKANTLLAYVTSRQFTSQIESLVETYQAMLVELEKERTSFERIWKQRESQIKRLLYGVSGIYGYLQDVTGPSLPPIKSLELPGSEE